MKTKAISTPNSRHRCDAEMKCDIREADRVDVDVCSLEHIFAVQLDLMNHFRDAGLEIPQHPVDLTSKQGQRACRDAGLKAVEEMFEALACFKNWKPHRRTLIPEFDRVSWLEEVVDSLAYQWEMLILANVTPIELATAIRSKASKVHKRIDEGY